MSNASFPSQAIMTLQRMYYRWKANKSIRERGFEIFEKRYDQVEQEYYYFDKRFDT
jgi:hypothetical protein